MSATAAVKASEVKALLESGLSDGEFARRIAAGDGRVFGGLMRKPSSLTYRVARAILRNDADATGSFPPSSPPAHCR